VVVADSSKIGREEFVGFAPVSSLDVLVTDSEITAADHDNLAREGLEVVVAQSTS
jgi:DeoR family fructose operon transcriptional repressor